MKPTSLEGVGSHAEAILRGWTTPAGLTASDLEFPALDMQNDSGEDLLEGQAVVVLSDGTIAKTSTVGDSRPTGICVDDIADGESGPVAFIGPVDLVRVTASVTAGTWGRTSTTAGAVETAADGFVYFTSGGTEPEGFLWPRGSGGGGGGGTTGDFLLNAWGEQHVVFTVADAGSALALDLSDANVFDITLTADCTLTFSNPPDSGVLGEWTLILRQGSTGGWTVTWPASVAWQDTDGTTGGAAPTLFTAATAEDVLVITTLDGGTTYGGSPDGPVTGGGASALDDLSDVTITTPAADEQLQYVGGVWVNNARRWEPVTFDPGTGPEIVFDATDVVMTWETY